MPQLAVEQRDGLRTDALQPQQVEQRRRKLREQLLMDRARAGLADFDDPRRQVLADPGPLAQARRLEAGDRLGVLATMSAPFRYARILNGLSPFSSSMSPISPRMRAIAEVIEAASPRQRGALRFRCGSRAERAPPAASASRTARPCRAAPGRTGSRHRRRRRPCAACAPAAMRARDQIVNLRRGDARRQPLAVVPLLGEVPPVAVPVAALERRRASRRRCRECARSNRTRARSPSM